MLILVGMLFIVFAIVFTLVAVGQQQELRGRAIGEGVIKFFGSNVTGGPGSYSASNRIIGIRVTPQ